MDIKAKYPQINRDFHCIPINQFELSRIILFKISNDQIYIE